MADKPAKKPAKKKPAKKIHLRRRAPQIVKDHRMGWNLKRMAQRRAARRYLRALHGPIEEPADEVARRIQRFLLEARPDVEPIVHGTPRLYMSGLSDIQFTVNGGTDKEGRVANRWTIRAIHSGELLGVPATGREVTFGGVSIAAVDSRQVTLPEPYKDAKGREVTEDWIAWVLEEWNYWDLPGLVGQLRGDRPS
jgi:SnoaL-like polyketide cyclase